MVTVIKLGGSILTGVDAFRRAAAFIAGRLAENRGEKLAIVVSAERGATDHLQALARELSHEPEAATLDLLWSTGEVRSVALLALSLHTLGVRAAALNVHQTGIVAQGTGTDGAIGVKPLRLRSALASHDVVVVPGFLARAEGDAIVSLGRGGSDLTAVLLAKALGAGRCELVKDVAGYHSGDPHGDDDAKHIPSLTFEEALVMADEGCGLVQRQALEAARHSGLRLIVRNVRGQGSVVSGKLERWPVTA